MDYKRGDLMIGLHGMRIRNKDTGKQMEFWYDRVEDRDRNLKMFHRDMFELVELMGEQQELAFDIRD